MLVEEQKTKLMESDFSINTFNSNNPDLSKTRLKGILLYSSCYCLFSILILFQRINYLYFPQSTTNVQNFWRGIVCFICSNSVFFLIEKKRIDETTFDKSYIKYLIPRVIGDTLFQYYCILASNNLKVSTTVILSNISPVVIAFYCWIFLREKIGKIDVISLAVCLIGVLIVSNPFDNNSNSGLGGGEGGGTKTSEVSIDKSIGFLYTFVMIICNSTYYTCQKLIGIKIDTSLVQAWNAVGYLIASITYQVVFYSENPISNYIPTSFNQFFYLFAVGFLTWLTQYLVIQGIRNCELIYLQPFTYLSIFFSFIFGKLILDEQYIITDYIGALLILVINLYRCYLVRIEKLE